MATPEKKKYNIEAFLQFASEADERYELFDGEIVALAGASVSHQRIIGKLYRKISDHIDKKGGKCETLFAPTDVILDDYNCVQPDVFVVCDPSKIDDKRVTGAPDLVIEVTSTNRSDDFTRKFEVYKNFGVREYWIIDPIYERVLVYRFEKNAPAEIYTFSQQIPVGIYEGELEICINDIMA